MHPMTQYRVMTPFWKAIDLTLKVPSHGVKAQKIALLENSIHQWRDAHQDPH